MLDPGSQRCFLTERMKNKLGFSNNNKKPACVYSLNKLSFNVSDRCELTVSSLTSPYEVNIRCFVVEHLIDSLPNNYVDTSKLNIPADIQLADPGFYRPSEVDLLLSAEFFFSITTSDKIELGPNKPVLQSSKLGWLVAGPVSDVDSDEDEIVRCCFTKQISQDLTRFWELEEISLPNVTKSGSDNICEQHFLDNTRRLDNGRFLVKMPLRENPETALGDSFNMAKKRFLNLETRLNKNPVLKKQYCDFIKEYEELGHLSKIDKPDFGYYAPHHAIIRDSETTKLRVVFDCSAKSSSQKSLNDIQYIGPVIQDELFDILIRFRQHKYVLSGDIQKMYRQIFLDESQRHLQLILWRDDKTKPLDVLRLNTVTYGTSSAPFLSARCLVQLANECPDKIVSEIIKHDFYYDDFLSGAESESNLRHIYELVKETLASACFPIHKFRTNCPQIFEDDCTSTQSLDLNKQASVLGLIWFPDHDTLQFSVKSLVLTVVEVCGLDFAGPFMISSKKGKGHFLVGRPMTSLPSPPVCLKNPDRYQRIEQLRQHFWQRWRNEYLAELQQRTKWRQRQKELKVGDLVVFKEENTPPLKWRLGRALHLYSGADGVCRVADFTTQKGVVRRALNRVCPLACTNDLESSSFQGGQGVNASAVKPVPEG
ncbi:uncharacterized protein LOC133530859 [Cydia pomonella]|uniref:uncharacterized protein LOC133530859 n=1 Tax=Cydia pomonella TaxID=82600 RepID=UPI002ADDBA71|nr:uncharacterized protein LOC133530859 [Cydia pomonella]